MTQQEGIEDENEYHILGEPYDIESSQSELDRVLDYLNKRDTDIAMLVNGPQGYKPIKSLDYIVSGTFYKQMPNTETLFETSNLYQIFANILAYLLDKINEMDFEICSPNPNWPSKDIVPSVNERRIFILADLLDTINRLLPISMKLRLFLLKTKHLELFIRLISNENFIANGLAYDFSLVRSTIFDINWLSKSADMNKIEWRQLNAIPALLIFLKRTTERLKIYIYMACANIADDNEIEQIAEIQTSIETFVGFSNQIANELLNNCAQRSPAQFKDEDDDDNTKSVTYDVCFTMDWENNATISLTGTLLAIYRLSVNPKSKWAIWSKINFKESLKTILRMGNDIEKLYSIQVLAQLAFDKQVMDNMVNDKEFTNLVKNIANADTSVVHLEKVKKIAKQMTWSFEENSKDPLKEKKLKVDSQEDDKRHIMISYNTASRELCLKIKEELEKENHKIWIDVNEIHGSSLDSMAKAVEGSKCIIMCVTEKYRQSLNCQAEAQYSFRLNKNIIPVIMQKGYHNVDGWLGFIIGDKIFIDFTKYSFEDSLTRLKNQINMITNPQKSKIQNIAPTYAAPIPTQNQTQSLNSTNQKIADSSVNSSLDTNVIKIIVQGDVNSLRKITLKNKIDEWSESDVNGWFKDIDLLDSFIYKQLSPCTGELLSQLHQIQLYAPEFFFKAITPNFDNKFEDLKKVASFAMHLKKLFQT